MLDWSAGRVGGIKAPSGPGSRPPSSMESDMIWIVLFVLVVAGVCSLAFYADR